MKQAVGAGATVTALVMTAAMSGASCGARREEATAPSATSLTSVVTAPTSPTSPTSVPADAPAAPPGNPACAPRRDAGAPPLWWEDAKATPADGQQEIDASLPMLAAALERHVADYGDYPVGQLAFTPTDSCCRQNFGGRGLCAPSATAFDAELWCTLGFQPRGAHYFQYMFVGTKTSSTLVATADLDCDGISISYVITAALHGGAPQVQITAPRPGVD